MKAVKSLFLEEEFKGGLRWLVLALFATSVLAVSPLITDWLWAILAAISLWFLAEKKWLRLGRYNSLVMAVSVLGYVTLVLLLEENWLSAQSITGFLAMVVLLKLIEIRTKKEVLWVVAALLVLIGIGTLYWNSVVGLAFLMVILFGIVFSMVLLSQVGKLDWKQDLITSSKLFGLALPVALVLFFFMPRFSGPIWDLGLAFGVPITLTQSAPPKPLMEGNRLRSDQYSSFISQSNTVLVAEFSGKVPFKSDMYWRGPVFTKFDGLEWFVDEQDLTRRGLMRGKIKTKKAWEKVVDYQGDPQNYNVRVMPHGQRWLYALETSATGAPETFLSRDFQVLSIRNIHQEFSYDATWLQKYRIKPDYPDEFFQENLRFPENSHPGLLKFGQELAEKYPDHEERILSLYAMFKSSFRKSERTEEVKPDYLDDVWLKHKSGSMLDIASATTLVLRASGIPARMVAGFRGGNLVALTDFVMVKQSHAHIWLEAWLDDKGWVRVEPQDFIGVQDINNKKSSVVKADAMNQKKPQENNEIGEKNTSPNKQSRTQAKQVQSVGDNAIGSKQASSEIEGTEEEKWWHAFDKWLVQYDADKQEQLLEKVGSSSGGSGLKLTIIAFGSLLLLLPLYFLVLAYLSRPRADKVSRLYLNLQNRLSEVVHIIDNECPSNYVQRLRVENAQLADTVDPLVQQYLEFKYGAQTVDEKTLSKHFERVLGLLS